jgi:hypothetical protein
MNGRRSRTVYSITPSGRNALARWLEAESAPPQMESEAVLRATFADAGTTGALLAALRSLRAHGEALRQQLGDQAADYLATGGPFPERLHLIALIGKFLSDYAELLEGWATWAEATVADWPATGPASAVPVPTEVFDLVLRRARRPPPDSRPGLDTIESATGGLPHPRPQHATISADPLARLIRRIGGSSPWQRTREVFTFRAGRCRRRGGPAALPEVHHRSGSRRCRVGSSWPSASRCISGATHTNQDPCPASDQDHRTGAASRNHGACRHLLPDPDGRGLVAPRRCLYLCRGCPTLNPRVRGSSPWRHTRSDLAL